MGTDTPLQLLLHPLLLLLLLLLQQMALQTPPKHPGSHMEYYCC